MVFTGSKEVRRGTAADWAALEKAIKERPSDIAWPTIQPKKKSGKRQTGGDGDVTKATSRKGRAE